MKLQVEHLGFSYEEREILRDVGFGVEDGEFLGLIGPNGSGKSTILKNIYRALAPKDGVIWFDGKNLQKLGHRECARRLSVVGQEHETAFDFKVEEIVAMGRTPHKKWFEPDTPEDREQVAESLRLLGMEGSAEREYTRLSGGEKQRVLIARALAQDAECMILDEPTNHLDIHCQLNIFELVKRLPITVMAAIHDLNLAAMYCDKICMLQDGQVYACGTPEEVLTEENIRAVYRVDSCILTHPVTGKKVITFLPYGAMNGTAQ